MRFNFKFFYKIIILSSLLLFPVNKLFAENLENVIQKLDRLENDLSDLQLKIYNESDGSNIDTSNISSNNLSVFDLRIREIENQISQLTNYVEEYVFEIEKLNERIDDLVLQQSNNLIQNSDTNNIINTEKDEENLEDSFSNNEEQSLGSLSISGTSLEEDQEIVNLNQDVLPEGSPDEQYQFAFDLLRSQKLNEAKIALEEFILKNDGHILLGSAKYWIGEIVYLQGEYKEAALIFAEGYQKYPESNKVPDMLFKLSISLSKIDKIEQACNSLNELIGSYPESKLIKKARLKVESLSCS